MSGAFKAIFACVKPDLQRFVDHPGGFVIMKWLDVMKYLDPSRPGVNLSSSVKLTLKLEEQNGSRVIIYFRYVMLVIFFVTAMLVSTNITEVSINLTFVAFLFAF